MRTPSPEPGPAIAPATEADTATILRFIRELARYEQLEDHVVATEESLRRWLFGDRPLAEAVIARVDGEPVGFALFMPNFSTFLGRPGIYLEDLYVREDMRGRGIGRALLSHVAASARDRGWGRVDWAVLEWNAPAIRFYESLGARILHDWRMCRLEGLALDALAGGTPGSRARRKELAGSPERKREKVKGKNKGEETR